LGTIKPSSHPKLFEGLPHPLFEAGSLRQEIAKKQTFEWHGYRFYDEPLWIPEEIEAILGELTTSDQRYRNYTGMKKCGGFHPDYALSWNGASVEILLCFGGGEARIFGGKQCPGWSISKRARISGCRSCSRNTESIDLNVGND